MQVPLQRYRVSKRSYCETPAPPQYDSSDEARKVQDDGVVTWRGHNWRVGKAFISERVAMRQDSNEDGYFDVCWSTLRIARINLNDQSIQTGRFII